MGPPKRRPADVVAYVPRRPRTVVMRSVFLGAVLSFSGVECRVLEDDRATGIFERELEALGDQRVERLFELLQ